MILQLVTVTTRRAASLQSVITAHTVRGGAAMSIAAWISPAPLVSGRTSAQASPRVSRCWVWTLGAQANAETGQSATARARREWRRMIIGFAMPTFDHPVDTIRPKDRFG